MAKVLYIKASPRTERSYSMAVANVFVEAYKAKNPNDEVMVLDLFGKDLIPYDGLAVQAKYTIMRGKKHSDEEAKAWKAVEATIEEFKSADKYVFAIPMWNFGIPYRLKQYFDIIVQPSYTFAVSDKGYEGLVTGKPAFVAYASGGQYPEGSDYSAYDFQRPYMKMILGFMGITDIKTAIVEPTLQGGPEVAAQKKEEAIVLARELAQTF